MLSQTVSQVLMAVRYPQISQSKQPLVCLGKCVQDSGALLFLVCIGLFQNNVSVELFGVS